MPRTALACPECGADHNTGWKDDADATGLAGEDPSDFDYDSFVEREFGEPSKKRSGVSRVWSITALVLFAAFVLYYLLALL